jgi:queuine tRNA-ribosyltransferase
VAPAAGFVITFCVEANSGEARAGLLTTAHGEVKTPAFQAVATQAGVKALSAEDVEATGGRLVIMNTYHLWLRPGPELVAELGGLHAFSRWPHSISTDSGGFQAFSLAQRTRVDEDGFEFASHLDGRRMKLTPEEAMRVQGMLGADIVMQLDVCAPGGSERSVLVAAVERTTRWAERCLAACSKDQALFAIVQGGTDIELRLAHLEALVKLPVAGVALGGFSVGEPVPLMHEALSAVVPRMDTLRPRYLMGVGTPLDLLHAIGCGIDMFDCVMPTRNARNGQAFVPSGKLVVKNAKYRNDPRPLDASCECPACRGGYSRSYLRHLFMAREILAHRLISQHNLHYYQSLVAEARRAIVEGRYFAWAEAVRSGFAAGASE